MATQTSSLVLVVRLCVREVSLILHSSYIGMNVCVSAYENGCVVDGMCATAAVFFIFNLTIFDCIIVITKATAFPNSESINFTHYCYFLVCITIF